MVRIKENPPRHLGGYAEEVHGGLGRAILNERPPPVALKLDGESGQTFASDKAPAGTSSIFAFSWRKSKTFS